MRLDRYSIGICFDRNSMESKEDPYSSSWDILFSSIAPDYLAGASLYGVEPDSDTYPDIGYICVITGIERKQAKKIADMIWHSPRILSKLSFYLPMIQHNKLEKMDAIHFLGNVSEDAYIRGGEDNFGDMHFTGKKIEDEPRPESYSVITAVSKDAVPIIREYLFSCSDNKKYVPFPVTYRLVEPALVKQAGGRIVKDDATHSYIAILPDETILTDGDCNGFETERKIQEGYTRFIFNACGGDSDDSAAGVEVIQSDSFLKRTLEIFRFDDLAARADNVIVLQLEENTDDQWYHLLEANKMNAHVESIEVPKK